MGQNGLGAHRRGGRYSGVSGRQPVRVVVYSDAVTVGGAEESLANLVAELGSNLEVIVLGVERPVVEAIAGRRNAPARVLPPVRNKADLRAILAHLRVLRELRPDVLHVSLPEPWACRYAIWTGLLTRGTSVIAVEQLPLPVEGRWRRTVKRFTSRRLAAHVAAGERSARIVERYAGLPERSVKGIFNGVPDVPLEPVPRPTAGPIVGSLGRLHSQKGYDVLLRAVAPIREASAMLVGEGPERERLEALARELGIGERLYLPGWSEQARRRLTCFDVFALPSRFEGFPLALVEAMLAGLPVVAANVGSVAEAVRHGETGLLVEADDPEALSQAIAKLLADAELRRRMGDRARARALERFTSAAMAREFEALYAQAVR